MTARMADRITPTAHASAAGLPWPVALWAAIPSLDAAAADHLAEAADALTRARRGGVEIWAAGAFDAADALARAAGALRPTGGGAIASAADRARAWHTIPAAHAAAHLADAAAAMLASMTRAALEGDA